MVRILDWLFQDKNVKALKNIEFNRSLCLLDVGARGGVDWPWSMFSDNELSLILVEPDPHEATELECNNKSNSTTVLPFALWSEQSKLTLYLNNSPGTSSVFKPNRTFLEQFPNAERFDAKSTVEIQADSIDNLASRNVISNIDFAKIDVQGAELAIIEGGEKFLSSELIGLEVEVEFSGLYSGQPLFGDVESFVRNNIGLELWDIKKTYWKYKDGIEPIGPVKGKLVFGDALFLRPILGLNKWLEKMDKTKASEKMTMLLVTAIAYGYLDYASALLRDSSISKYLEEELIHDFFRSINTLSGGFRPFRNGNEYIYTCLDFVARAFKPTHQGWGSIGRRLGSRRRGSVWF